jgi:hypothetical protein
MIEKQNNAYYELLAKQLIDENETYLFDYNFRQMLRHQSEIEKLDGDIVECGVWKGGASIFMSHLWPVKTMWACDSFEGFQPLESGLFTYTGEKEDIWNENLLKDTMTLSLDYVKGNFAKYGLGDRKNINFLKGFVKDTLNPKTCPIEKIALLRIDVDAYSATKEVLEYLYPKVVKGGYIIFDDSEIVEANHAMKDYFKENNIEVEYLHPVTDEVCLDLPEANYSNDWHVAYPEGHSYGGKIIPTGLYIIKK